MRHTGEMKPELAKELKRLRARVAALQRAEVERKRAEKALQESEARLRSLFETMAEGVILIAPDGQIVQANPAAERILGLERPVIESRNYVSPEWEILRPDGTPMPPEEMAGPRAMKEMRLVKDVVMGVKRPDGAIDKAWRRAPALVSQPPYVYKLLPHPCYFPMRGRMSAMRVFRSV